jgi:hypothetical protein
MHCEVELVILLRNIIWRALHSVLQEDLGTTRFIYYFNNTAARLISSDSQVHSYEKERNSPRQTPKNRCRGLNSQTSLINISRFSIQMSFPCAVC